VQENSNIAAIVKEHKGLICKIAIMCGFSYITFPVAFTIANSILPAVKAVTIAKTLQINTCLTILDGAMIVIAGYMMQFMRLKHFMAACAVLLACFEMLLFWLMPTADVSQITLMRAMVILLGIPFSIALKIWVASMTEQCGKHKYLVSAIGGSMGMEILGRTLVIWSLSSFHFGGNFVLPMLYVALMCGAALWSLK
jgi:hypothetical protein